MFNSSVFPIQTFYRMAILLLTTPIWVGCAKGFNLNSSGSLIEVLTPPVVLSPSNTTYYSRDGSLVVKGTCVEGATVEISGSASVTVLCDAGTFTQTINKTSDGTYTFVFKQKKESGATSDTASITWIRDSVAPTTPFRSSPSLNPFQSKNDSLTITGECEDDATVALSGDATDSVACASETFTFTVSKLVDTSYSFSLKQTDLAGNVSPLNTFVWKRDTAAPAAPIVTGPASNPHTSAGSTLTLTGTCESGATVSITGDATASVTCNASLFSLPISKSSDGTYNFSLIQTDVAGNASVASTFQWVRDSSLPSTPVITAPTTTQYYSSGSSLVISGTCTTGDTVSLSGDDTASMACASSAFSFTVNKALDATYNFSIKQTNGLLVDSGSANLIWIRDTSAPATVTITSPASNPYLSNGSSALITGTCEANATVHVSGDTRTSTVCNSGTYSVFVSVTADGTFSYSLKQVDQAGNASGTVTLSWIRQTTQPLAPTITNPYTDSYTSGDDSLTISGTCQATNTVALTGDDSGSTVCSNIGRYSFTIAKTVDGTFTFTIYQTDAYGNISASVTQKWTRDGTMPFTPVISVPASNPYLSNGNDVTITATCNTTLTPLSATLNIDGDVTALEVSSPAGSTSQTCSASPSSFTIQKSSDGTYNFLLSQDDPNLLTSSADAFMQWIRDSVAPFAPILIVPYTSPYTSPTNLRIEGACEANATVNLTGADTQQATCAVDGTFSFTVVKGVDATYVFSLTQTDSAGNVSTATALSWVRDSTSVEAPTIDIPLTNPFLSNRTSLTISGDCIGGATLAISGSLVAADVTSPVGSLTQTCVGGTYSYVITKTVDGVFSFSIVQTVGVVTSSGAQLFWSRDTTAPIVTITGNPDKQNLNAAANFTFSSNEFGSTFECKIDSGSYASCSSPFVAAGLSNAHHTFYVKATDAAKNVGTEVSYEWDQFVFNTIALYHFNNGSAQSDSGNYTKMSALGDFLNDLSPTGTPANDTTGKYPTSSKSSRSFGTNMYYSVVDNNTLDLGTQTLTIEGFVKPGTAINTIGDYYTLVSKSGSAAPNYGWEVRLKKTTNSKYALVFVASLDGTTQTTVVSNNINLNVSNWYYFAVTWNKGAVRFYFGANAASSKGSKTIGTLGSATIATKNGLLRLGAGQATGTGQSLWFPGSLDEVRLSQIVRTITFPSGEFTAD
jgi:large repetitive protein